MTENSIKVWDLPLRLFHWLLAAAVISAVVTAKVGGDLMVWHGRLGLMIFGLLVFRLLWGLFGSHYARFSSFMPTIASVRAYLQGSWRGYGHNPLGAFSVFALLAALLLQAGSGFFAEDDIAYHGFLNPLVSEQVVEFAGELHEAMQVVLYILVTLHLMAIVFYAKVKKHNLVRPMITGKHPIEDDVTSNPQPAVVVNKLAFLLCLAVAVAATAGIATATRWNPTPHVAIPEHKADW